MCGEGMGTDDQESNAPLDEGGEKITKVGDHAEPWSRSPSVCSMVCLIGDLRVTNTNLKRKFSTFRRQSVPGLPSA